MKQESNLFEVYQLADVNISVGRGSYLWDELGTEYLDLYGGHAVISIGHSHPHYTRRITEQLDKIGFYSNSVGIPLQHEVAEKLRALSGKAGHRLFFCNSGAEANENAMKLASFHTGRKKIVAFTGAFHGRTSLALAATYNTSIMAPVNESAHVVFLPFNRVDPLLSYFKRHGHEIAAVIVEPIQGVAGIREASTSFLNTIRSVCDQYGSVFIADEVQCGYGRTGRFFALDHAEVTADIYTMAKGMGNGFPIGGVFISPHIRAKYGMLGTTFGGNHLGCAAALAVLEIIEKEDLVYMAHDSGKLLKANLKNLGLTDVRGKGLMIGIDLPERHKHLRRLLLTSHRIFTGHANPNTIRILPALNIRKSDLKIFLEILENTMNPQPVLN